MNKQNQGDGEKVKTMHDADAEANADLYEREQGAGELRAELGVDGNCGFAMLGENIQSGEAEFVEINYDAKFPVGDHLMRSHCEITAARAAFEKLKSRLNIPTLSFYFGISHPFGN